MSNQIQWFIPRRNPTTALEGDVVKIGPKNIYISKTITTKISTKRIRLGITKDNLPVIAETEEPNGLTLNRTTYGSGSILTNRKGLSNWLVEYNLQDRKFIMQYNADNNCWVAVDELLD